jgi:hypothetical protein
VPVGQEVEPAARPVREAGAVGDGV